MWSRFRTVTLIQFVFFVLLVFVTVSSEADEVSFSRDILPVLSDRCFHCHGPDEENREADLRLDVEAGAKADLGGYKAITPGNLQNSEIWNRITSSDAETVMPPSDSHRKPLTKGEQEAIRKWILSGAKWGKHWSFESLSRPEVPEIDAHPIDAFIKETLEGEELTLSNPAKPHVQLRRLSFDLTGMSPSPEDIAAFDGSDKAWEAAINRSLQSPHFAERMAMWWLDAARYSDSDGFQQDATRQNWPWRDWVIQQFQENKSFRDFTIEQFAGDLLPNATDEQILATCFHRNHMTNGEGGRDPEESRIDYVIDRVNTTGTVWLGLTLGCVQCHSHKFDPISQHDYYSLSAFFNSIDENGKAGNGAKPYLKYQSQLVEARVKEMEAFVNDCRLREKEERQAAEKRFTNWLENFATVPPDEYHVWHTPPPEIISSDGTQFDVASDQIVQATGPKPRQDDYRVSLSIPENLPRVTGLRLEVFPHESHVDGRFTRDGNGEFTLTSVRVLARRQDSPAEAQLEISSAKADVERNKDFNSDWDTRYGRINDTRNDDARDGWTTLGVEQLDPRVGVFELAEPWQAKPGDRLVVLLRHRSTHGHANIARFRLAIATERGETVRRVDGASPLKSLHNLLASGTSIDNLDKDLKKRLLSQYLLDDEPFQEVAQKLSSANQQLSSLKNAAKPRNVMVLAERKEPRDTHILVRGVWNAKGDLVERGVLPSVLAWPTEKAESRLDLAHWIVSPENPLTARVVVNHLWQIMFGQGLVRTPEDFGLQGEFPTHPKLLDWLAIELIEHDWDLRHILRLIATSKTYRQSSVPTPELLQRDPENQLLARAPRFRLPAWMIRDNALAVSGLLNPAVGGPPVYPYQPKGVWAEITMGRFDYPLSLGPAQYRRTIYAFWRRSSAPTFLFDSAQRRVCEVGVRRTNTPLHALTLLNDLTMLEASRVIADEAITISPNDSVGWTTDQAKFLALKVLSREIQPDELEELHEVWSSAFAFYQKNREDAVRYCTVGQQLPPQDEVAPTTAAWMTVASLLLNLDEAMTRE